MPLDFGVNDVEPSPASFDALEAAYSGGAGTGVGRRIPACRKFINDWASASSVFTSSHRTTALFKAGHRMIVSFKPPAAYTTIINGSQDSVIDALGDRIYALPYGAAVSGSQPGASYGGTTATVIRISLHHEMDNDTTYGTADQYKQAYRRFMKRIKARKPAGTPERVICLPIFTGQANNNGKAAQFYPGNTADDYCDELGIDPYFFGVTARVTFDARLKPWQKWRDTNAKGRKIAVCETNRHDNDVDSVWYIGTIIPGWLLNPDVSIVTYFSSVNGDPGSILKNKRPDQWQAFKEAVDAAYNATPPAPDTSALPAPSGLSAPQVGETSVGLTWAAPTDPAVGGYQVFRNGTVVGTVPGASSTSFTDTGLTAATPYAYRVKATPASGSTRVASALSAAINVTTSHVAAFDPPQITAADIAANGRDVTATATATDPASGTLTYVWDWGDGSDTDDGASASHTYATVGNYTVKVTATSSISGLPTFQLIAIVAQETDLDRTPLGFQVPIKDVTTFYDVGRMVRENAWLTDGLIAALSDRSVQNGDDDPFPRRPILSLINITATDEEPSDEYPNGRTILTGGAGGGGGSPGPGTITETMLAFDVATQPEMDAALAGKLPVGYTDPGKVSVGSIGRSQDCLIHGWAMETFAIAAMSNNGGYTIAAGNVTHTAAIAEIDTTITTLLFAVASAGDGSGYTIRMHAADGTLLKTATAGSGTGGTDAAMTGTGARSVTIPGQAVTRGTLYRFSFHAPAGVSGPNIRATSLFVGSILNMGLATADLWSATYAAGSSPSNLNLAAGAAAAPLFFAAK